MLVTPGSEKIKSPGLTIHLAMGQLACDTGVLLGSIKVGRKGVGKERLPPIDQRFLSLPNLPQL